MLHYIETAWNNGKQHSNKQYRNVVVFGTYNRAHLMRQSMYAYQESLFENDCIVVLDDGSTDDTLQVCEQYAERMDVFYFKLEDKAPGEWRDSAAFLNMGISFAIHALNAQRVIPTHPEIVPGVQTFDAINSDPPFDFVMFRGYYLPIELQLRYEAFVELVKSDWDKQGIETNWSIQRFKALCPDWYDYGDKNHDFHPNNLEADKRAFDSWIFCAAKSETWKQFKGMPESSNWGTVDMAFLKQRYEFGFTSATPNEVDAWVLHQNHDDPTRNVLTPRVMEVWVEDMKANHNQYTTIGSKPDYLNPERWKPKSSYRIEKTDLENMEIDPLPIRRGCIGECACIGSCLDIVGYISRIDYEQGKLLSV